MYVPLKTSTNSQVIICFDGFCSFCSAMAPFIHARDKQHVIHFVALQSEAGKKLLSSFPGAPTNTESLILIESERLFTESDAALGIAKRLNGYWPLLYFLKIIPASIRDFLYQQFAQRRYAWFGKNNLCFTPDQTLDESFVS